eukprot:gene11778-13903_t
MALDFFREELVNSGKLQAVVGLCYLAAQASVFTHALVGPQKHGESYHFWQPFSGGTLYILLQAGSWTFYAFGTLGALVCLHDLLQGQVPTRGCICTLGVGGFISEVFMVISIFVFNKKGSVPGKSWHNISIFGALLSASSIVLCTIFLESGSGLQIEDTFFRYHLGSLTSVNSLVAVALTHGLAGPSKNSGYKCLQPFVGGAQFVLLQGFGWTFYALTIVGTSAWILNDELLAFPASAVSWLGGFSQLLMTLSLFVFDGDKRLGIHFLARLKGWLWFLCLLMTSLAVVISVSLDYYSKGSGVIPTFVGSLTSTVLTFIAIPLTHWSACANTPTPIHRVPYKFYQPFVGGTFFVLLQAFGWSFYSLSVLAGLNCISTGITEELPPDGILSTVGCAGFISNILILVSLYYFEHSPGVPVHDGYGSPASCASPAPCPRASESLPVDRLSQARELSLDLITSFAKSSQTQDPLDFMIARLTAYRAERLCQAPRSSSSAVLPAVTPVAAATPRSKSRGRSRSRGTSRGASPEAPLNTWETFAVLNFLLVAVSFLLLFAADQHKDASREWTGGAAASLVFIAVAVPLTHGLASKRCHAYNFWQPFRGGHTFVWFQALGWSIYGVCIFGVLSCIYLQRTWGIQPMTGALSCIGAGGFMAQTLVAASIFYFDNRAAGLTGKKRRPRVMSDPGVFITLEQFQGAADALLAAARAARRRRWEAVRESKYLERVVADYFSLCISGSPKLEPNKQYIFGYHPHGTYPGTIAWATASSTWRRFYSKRIIPCVASIIFYIPGLRDVLLWYGGQDVSKRNVVKLLRRGESVILVPGGQREMQLQMESVQSKQKILVTGHKGFIRLALEMGVDLVPVFSFGENE